MPNSKKARPKKKSRFEQFWTGGKGTIDPRLIRKAVEEVIAEDRAKKAEAKALARLQRNGMSPAADSE